MDDKTLVLNKVLQEPDGSVLAQMLGLLPSPEKPDKVTRVRGAKTWCIKHDIGKREEATGRYRCLKCRQEEVQRRAERKKAQND